MHHESRAREGRRRRVKRTRPRRDAMAGRGGGGGEAESDRQFGCTRARPLIAQRGGGEGGGASVMRGAVPSEVGCGDTPTVRALRSGHATGAGSEPALVAVGMPQRPPESSARGQLCGGHSDPTPRGLALCGWHGPFQSALVDKGEGNSNALNMYL